MSVIQEVPLSDQRVSISVTNSEEGNYVEVCLPTFPSLVTHVALRLKDPQANENFRIISIETRKGEGEDYSSLHDYETSEIEPNLDFSQPGSILLIPALGVSYGMKLCFLNQNSDFDDLDKEVAAIAQGPNYTNKNFYENFSQVTLVGYSLSAGPSASSVVALLNIASYLKTFPEGIDADYVAGLALMNARRFVQGAEFLRRAQNRLVGSLDIPVRSPRVLTSGNRPPSVTTNKRLLRAAKFELLVAEGFNQHGQILDKLFAYERATEMYLGGIELEAVTLDSDVYSSLLGLQPHLSRLLLRNLQDTLEPLKIACVRGLEFLLEHLGCSLGPQLGSILKIIINTYPSSNPQFQLESFNNSLLSNNSMSEVLHKEDPSPGVVDSYNRLLETFLTTLSSAAPQILHSIFHEVLSHHLLINELPKDLKSYLLKITEKVTLICEGDLDYGNSLLTGLMSMRRTEGITDQANKLWETVKTRVLTNYKGSKLSNLIKWVSELLTGDSEEDCIYEALDLIVLLSSTQSTNSLIKPRPLLELKALIPPLLHWLDHAASSVHRLELFQAVWRGLVGIHKQTNDVSLSNCVFPLLRRTKDYFQNSSPSQNMLVFLETILQDLPAESLVTEFLVEFLPVFCKSIPNNVHDEVFSILNQILGFIGKSLSDQHLKALLDSMIDQYTVKSQSQKQSKAYLINLILSEPSYLEFVFQYCLLNNKEVFLDSEKNDRQRIIQEHDFFLEKLSFGIEVMSLLEPQHSPIAFSITDQIGVTAQRLLNSKNSHVRIRALEILRLQGELTLSNHEEEAFGIAGIISDVVKPHLEKNSDPKVVFYSLQLIDMIFKHLIPVNLDEKQYQEARISEALKVWNGVQLQISSPWSNIRAIAFSIMCSWVQVSLADLRQQLSNKVKSFLLPLLLSLLSCKESESRAGALNILGSFCGMNLPEDADQPQDFRKHSQVIPLALWEQVFHLQDDWDPMIRDASSVLIQLSAPKEAVRHFYQLQQEELSLRVFNSGSSDSEDSMYGLNDQNIFWAETYNSQEVLELVSMFRTDSQNPTQLWSEQLEPKEDDFLEVGPEEVKQEDEEETLEQLGVIDVEDELLEGCDDENNSYPVIKNSYARKRGLQVPESKKTEEHSWSRTLRPHNSSLRPCTPPARAHLELPKEEDTRYSQPELNEIPEFSPEEEVSSHQRKSSLEELEELFESNLKEEPAKSPRTPRRKIETDFANQLKNLTSAPSASNLGKIYLQKPDLGIFKKKSKSLNTSLNRSRRGPLKITRNQAKK